MLRAPQLPTFANFGALLVLLSLSVPSHLDAQASISVRVYDSAGRNMDGHVTLRRGTTSRSCQTVTGNCQIIGIAPGTYTATLAPVREHAPPAIQVQVPVAGVLTLSFRSVPQPATASAVGTTTTMVQTGTGSSGNTGGARPVGQTSTQEATSGTMVSGAVLTGMSGALTGNVAGSLGFQGSGPAGMTTVAMASGCTPGRLLNSAGRPSSGWVQVTAGSSRTPRIQVGADGAFRVCGVTPGRWTVTAQGAGAQQRHSRTVRAGGNLTLRLRRNRVRRPRSQPRRRVRR